MPVTPSQTSAPSGSIPPATSPATTSIPNPTAGALPRLEIHFLDVGQGDAILINFQDTEILIDAGDNAHDVVPYLRKLVQGPIEAVMATHADADHIGGMPKVLNAFAVDRYYWNGYSATTQTFNNVMTLARSQVPRGPLPVKRGDTIQVDPFSFSVYNPPARLFSDSNNNSIVLKLIYGETSFLFTGDAEKEAEAEMLASGVDLFAQVLKVGHHGSSSSTSAAFLSAVRPATAIYMCGVGNRYGHPHQETLNALRSAGLDIFGTDKDGTIIVESDGKYYRVRTTGAA